MRPERANDGIARVPQAIGPKRFVLQETRNEQQRGAWDIHEGSHGMGEDVLKSGAPRLRPDPLKRRDHTIGNQGSVIFGKAGQQVEPDGT